MNNTTVATELVLIVDDDERNRRLARDVLEAAGFRTVAADSGEAALAAALAHPPDVILMDVRLPDMDGSEVLDRLRRDARTHAVPVVAFTSLPPSEEKSLERLGFDGYLEKPIDVAAFPDDVRAYLRV